MVTFADRMDEKTRQFIREHADDDVRQLALQGGRFPEVSLREAIVQIDGRQRARAKLPTWARTEGITWPERISLEQCSSEQTARYKAEIVKEIADEKGEMADLTGGLGVDFAALAPLFSRAHYVEQSAELCRLAEGNFPLLGLKNFSITCADGIDVFESLPHLHLIYIDPARRDKDGHRTFAIEDCTPNIVPIIPRFLRKADALLVKLSPMLDISSLAMPCLAEIHIVATQNEVKEIVLLFKNGCDGKPTIHCKNDDESTVFTSADRGNANISTQEISAGYYLYEPNAAVMKSGCFMGVARMFPQCSQVAANSHLFVARDRIDDFPGRKFQILTVSSMNKRELREALRGTERANITVRNFPISADELRRRLKLKDGGHRYIFATTLKDGSHRLIFCKKTDDDKT